MEQRITSLLLPAPEAELEASCKELDEKVTWVTILFSALTRMFPKPTFAP